MNVLQAEVIVITPMTQFIQKMGWEGQCASLKGSYFTCSAAGWGSQLPPQHSSGCPIATWWPVEESTQVRLKQSWKQWEMRRLFSSSFFSPGVCSPSFWKICFPSLVSGNPTGPALFCRQSTAFNLFHYFLLLCIYFTMFSERQAISLCAVTASSTRRKLY